MTKETDEARAQRWLRRFTNGLSPEGLDTLAVLQRTDRFSMTAEQRRNRDIHALERLEALPRQEARSVNLAWKLGPYASDLSRSSVAENVEELETLAEEVAEEDRPGVARILGAQESYTID